MSIDEDVSDCGELRCKARRGGERVHGEMGGKKDGIRGEKYEEISLYRG